MIDTIELKPGEYSFRDPKTLQPHPVSAALYLNGRDDWSIDTEQMTPLEASNEIMEKMDVSDILDSIARDGIRVPLVITPEGIIISGCRRWKVAMMLGLTTVPVEVKSFADEVEEKRAILDYNRSRVKNTSQTMREADLHMEIIGKLARKRILAGKRDPEPILAQGSKHKRKTNTIVGALSGMGKETFRKVEYIWQQAKSGDQKAVALIRNLDEKTTSINAAFNTLKKADNDLNPPQLSKWQKGEPVDAGVTWTCPRCGKTCRLFHLQNCEHRLVETGESDNSVGPTSETANSGD
jgi:hypothetical protein